MRECDLSDVVPSALFANYTATKDGVEIESIDLAVDGNTVLLKAAQEKEILDAFGAKILAACEKAAKGER